MCAHISGVDQYRHFGGSDTPPRSQYLTARTINTQQENQSIFKQSLVEGPASALHRVLDKISTLTGVRNTIASASISTSSKSDFDEEFGPSIVIAKQLEHKLKSVQKEYQNLLKHSSELQKELDFWGDNMVDPKCNLILKEAAGIFRAQVNWYSPLSTGCEEIRQALTVVADKETAVKKLRDCRVDLKKKWKVESGKYGDKSFNAQKASETLETNAANIRISETHYARAINENFMDAVQNYAMEVRAMAVNLEADAVRCEERLKGKNRFPGLNATKEVTNLPENKKSDGHTSMASHCAKCSIEAGRASSCKYSSGKKVVSATRIVPDDEFDRPIYDHFHGNESWN
ncbi:hypothetical protein PSN45_003126 [Yamadazyma tenuis]|uniref:uncharacterized protein n=1 Tax=Candida tenuis TaxID=2315449 RepID=UPI0027A9AD9E|nr:hypothetical protein PSN45_003126 [Yamadazyma tenuis]